MSKEAFNKIAEGLREAIAIVRGRMTTRFVLHGLHPRISHCRNVSLSGICMAGCDPGWCHKTEAERRSDARQSLAHAPEITEAELLAEI